MKLRDLKTSRLTLLADPIYFKRSVISDVFLAIKNPAIAAPLLSGTFLGVAAHLTKWPTSLSIVFGIAFGTFSMALVNSVRASRAQKLNNFIYNTHVPCRSFYDAYVEKKPKKIRAMNREAWREAAIYMQKEDASTIGRAFVWGSFLTMLAHQTIGMPFSHAASVSVCCTAPTVYQALRSGHMWGKVLKNKWIMGRLPSDDISRLYGNKMNVQPK